MPDIYDVNKPQSTDTTPTGATPSIPGVGQQVSNQQSVTGVTSSADAVNNTGINIAPQDIGQQPAVTPSPASPRGDMFVMNAQLPDNSKQKVPPVGAGGVVGTLPEENPMDVNTKSSAAAPQDLSSFSFQANGAGQSAGQIDLTTGKQPEEGVPQPTVPFETITLQNAGAPQEEKGEAEKKLGEFNVPADSFLERFKSEEVQKQAPAQEGASKIKEYSQVIPETLTAVPGASPLEAQAAVAATPTPAAAETQSYQMPDLPRPSFISRILPFVLVFLVIAGAIFAALKFLPQFSRPKEVTLTWWGLWEDEKTVQSLIESYKRLTPNVTIKYVKENPKDYRVRLQSAIARDEGPDIFRFHNTWLPMLKVELGAMPEKLKAQVNFTETFYPTTYFDLVRDNKIYGLPLMFDSLALFYNEDMFKNAGLTPPKIWDEVVSAAEKLTVVDAQKNIQIAGIALGNTTVEHWSDTLATMMLQDGADPSLPTDTCARETVEYFISFANGEKKVWTDALGNSILAFANGKVAMIIAPSWEVFELKKMNPNLSFGVSAFPQIPGGRRFWATYWVEGVNAKSKQSAEAWDFLMFLIKKENLQLFYSEASKERLFGELYPRLDMADSLKDDQLAWPFLEGAKEARSWYLASRTFDQGINDRLIKYYEDAINKINSKEQSVDEALKTLALGVQQVFKDYGLTVPATNSNCKPSTQ